MAEVPLAECFSGDVLARLQKPNWQWEGRLPTYSVEAINAMTKSLSLEDLEILNMNLAVISLNFRNDDDIKQQPRAVIEPIIDDVERYYQFRQVMGHRFGKAALLREMDSASQRIDLDRMAAKVLMLLFVSVEDTESLGKDLRAHRSKLLAEIAAGSPKSLGNVHRTFGQGFNLALLDIDWENSNEKWASAIEEYVQDPSAEHLTALKAWAVRYEFVRKLLLEKSHTEPKENTRWQRLVDDIVAL